MTVSYPAVVVSLVLAVAPAAQPAGEVYAPEEGGFKVRFPGEPKEHTQTAKTDLGDLKVRTATYALTDGSVYLVSSTTFPPGSAKADGRAATFDMVREGVVGKDGKLVSEKEITVGPDKLPGREIVVDKGKHQSRFRVVIKDRRLYQLAAVGTGEFVTGPEATAFFDSFLLTK